MLNKNANKRGFTQHHFPEKNGNVSFGKHFLSIRKNGAGFTIVELLAVMTVISIGLVGITNLISQVFTQSRFISSKLVAAYLVQEGIEIVRNIRDTNWLEPGPPPWNDGISAGEWEADYTSISLVDTYDGDFLKIDSGFYKYSVLGTQTEFQRKIKIEQQPGGEILVTVSVFWKNYEVKAVEKLYNWR